MRFKTPILAAIGAFVLFIGLIFAAGPSAHAATPDTIWGTNVPVASVADDTAAVELGTKFTALVNGTATGVRFYKTPENSGVHTGTLWSKSGTKLSTVTFANETSSGWQTAAFATPVALKAGTSYVVSYHTNVGRYQSTENFTGASVSTSLKVPKSNAGVYRYGKTAFPNSTWHSSQYWVDLTFNPVGTVPTPTATTPAPSASITPTVTPTPTPTVTPTTTVTPTPTATSTPPVGLLNCETTPSACGYPDSTNTGPAAGTAFTKVPSQATSGPGWEWADYLGAVRVTGANAVVSGLDVSGQIIIDAPNATVTNNIVSVCGNTNDPDVIAIRYRASDSSYQGSNATISHNTLNGLPSGCSYRARSGVRDIYGEAPNVTVDANNITGIGNGITIEYSGSVTNNWIHNLGHIAGDHHSGISSHGGAASLLWQHNTVLLANDVWNDGGGVSGALTIYSDFAHAQNITIQDNLISGGSYTVYGGNSGGSYTTPSTNIKFVNNRFVCGGWLYGPVAAFNSSSPGNAWTGNVCDADLSTVSG